LSISVSNRVWASSKTRIASHRLMLLAIADFANEGAEAWPSIRKLAERCCLTERSANRVIADLCQSGELERRISAGPQGTNVYRVRTGAGVSPVADVTPPDNSNTPDVHVTPDARATPVMNDTVTPATGGDDAGDLNPLTPMSPEPSMNHQEPSDQPLARPRPPRMPNCPHEEIVRLYHQQLPELPRVVLLDTRDRRDKLAEFWKWVLSSTKSDGNRRAETAEQALQWISDYFARARENDFVMGRSGRGPGHENWRCSLDYLLTDKGKTRVIERTEAVPA
jgi:hypothetical protein